MTALATAQRAVPYVATEFAAFRIADMGKGSAQRTYAVDIKGFHLETVDAACSAALIAQCFAHKDHLVIRETGERGVKLHLFAVRQRSAARTVYDRHVSRQVRDLYLAPVCSIDGGALLQGLGG